MIDAGEHKFSQPRTTDVIKSKRKVCKNIFIYLCYTVNKKFTRNTKRTELRVQRINSVHPIV